MLVQLVDFEDCVYFKYGFHNIKFGLSFFYKLE